MAQTLIKETATGPNRLLDALNAYQLTSALQAAIELDIFTAIAEGATTLGRLAEARGASERGVRVLCDYLCVEGFLTKSNGEYGLTEDTRTFLTRTSPMNLGPCVGFLCSDMMKSSARDVTSVVRQGKRLEPEVGLSDEHPIWQEFAKSMMPLMMLPAKLAAEQVATPGSPQKVLDIASGHGMFGISVLQANPRAEVSGVDWPGVLEYAKQNAKRFDVAERYHALPGSAFEIDFGSGYDLVLVPNFLHHFDEAKIAEFLGKAYRSLAQGGKIAIVEFVPNEDRVSPPFPAKFSLLMLLTTERGDAYTERQLREMLGAASFGNVARHDLAPAPQTLITATKK